MIGFLTHCLWWSTLERKFYTWHIFFSSRWLDGFVKILSLFMGLFAIFILLQYMIYGFDWFSAFFFLCSLWGGFTTSKGAAALIICISSKFGTTTYHLFEFSFKIFYSPNSACLCPKFTITVLETEDLLSGCLFYDW